MAAIQEFDNYAPDRFERLSETLAAKGLTVTGDSGEVKAFGADVTYDFDPTAQKLTLRINKAPYLHSFSSFCEELRQAVEEQR